MRRVDALLAGLLFLGACSIDPTVGPPERVNDRKAPEMVLDHQGLGVPVDTLESEIVSASDSFSVLGSVAVVGDYLVAGEAYNAPYLHILNRTTGALLASNGRTGNGPGEFDLSPQFVPRGFGTDSSLWLVPPLGRHATLIDINAVAERQSTWLKRTVQFEDPEFRPIGVWLSPDELLIKSYSPSGGIPLIIFDSLGVKQRTFAEVEITDDRLRAGGLSSAYRFNLCASPDGQHVALAFANTGRLQIRTRDSDSVIEAAVPYRYRPHLPLLGKILGEFKSGTAGHRQAYAECVATDSLVYASFLGTLRGRKRTAPPPGISFVHVFNWSGQLLQVLQLDHRMLDLDLDRVTNTLYTVTSFPESLGSNVRRMVLPR